MLMSLLKIQNQVRALLDQQESASARFRNALQAAKSPPNASNAHQARVAQFGGPREPDFSGPLIEVGPEINLRGGYDVRMGKIWDADSHSFIKFVVDGKENTLSLTKDGNKIAKFNSNGNEIENTGLINTVISKSTDTKYRDTSVHHFCKRIGTVDINFSKEKEGFEISTQRDESHINLARPVVYFSAREYGGSFSDEGIKVDTYSGDRIVGDVKIE